MAMDKLQEKIRKLKNPIAIDFSVLTEHIPAHLMAENDYLQAYRQFCCEIMEGLSQIIPAVRFSMSALSLYGSEGFAALTDMLSYARKLGFYILLDVPEFLNTQNLNGAAEMLFADSGKFHFDGLIVTAYTGSDAVRPYVAKLADTGKDLFVVARTSNKSAAEIQDLLSGSRHTHMAMAEVVNRFSEGLVGRCGYSQVALMAAASSADSVRAIRGKYKNMFLLLDGCDYPNANAKNCSYAFDALGHGALACVCLYVTAAWKDDPEPEDFVACAVRAAERMKKNFARYVTIL